MFQTDQATAASSLPAPAAAGTPGYFTGGNPASGVAATIVDADWLNMVQQELVNVATATGQTLSKTTYNQVLLAIQALIAGRAPGVVGSMRNAQMSVATASATATFTADQIVVGTSLTGLQYVLGSFSKTINLATTGAGGMDTGSAPASGYVALYAIYNPTTGTSALLATNATSSVAPNVYGGANMPSGYTASALVSVWPTNSSGQFKVANQIGNTVFFGGVLVLSVTATQASLTSFSIAGAVPQNAKSSVGSVNISASAATSLSGAVATSSAGAASQTTQIGGSSLSQLVSQFSIPILTAQTLYYLFTMAGGSSPALSIYISSYSF
ncbi:hypothetical protein PWR63_17550 [Paraburkholderia sp. A2WS-5]|uniref:hypothetical protein n=1 Tax=unclassified Paraburkholderia TaxID=2615204 RepID=UPI003B7861E1